MDKNIEIFYTGGGITLAETDLTDNSYAVVSSDAPNYLTIYRCTDNEKTYLPDDMLVSAPKEELTPNLKPLYIKMVEKLKTN